MARKPPKASDFPKTVQVGELTYKVRFAKSLDRFGFGQDTRGVCSHAEETIYILQRLKPMERFETLIHEVMHAFENAYGFKLPHRLIYQLERPWARLLLDNVLPTGSDED